MANPTTFEKGKVIGTRKIVGYENHSYITECIVCNSRWSTGLDRLKASKFRICRCSIIKKMRGSRGNVKVTEEAADVVNEWLSVSWFKKRRRT